MYFVTCFLSVCINCCFILCFWDRISLHSFGYELMEFIWPGTHRQSLTLPHMPSCPQQFSFDSASFKFIESWFCFSKDYILGTRQAQYDQVPSICWPGIIPGCQMPTPSTILDDHLSHTPCYCHMRLLVVSQTAQMTFLFLWMCGFMGWEQLSRLHQNITNCPESFSTCMGIFIFPTCLCQCIHCVSWRAHRPCSLSCSGELG